MVKPKNDPLDSDSNKNKIGENVDIVDEGKPKEGPVYIKGSKIRRKAVAIKDTSQSR